MEKMFNNFLTVKTSKKMVENPEFAKAMEFAKNPEFAKAMEFAMSPEFAKAVESAGGCTTGSGVNGAGLWIFTRARKRDDALIDEVRSIAADKGFDLSVLNDVDQTNCDAAPPAPTEPLVV
jgi:hypothetical protein